MSMMIGCLLRRGIVGIAMLALAGRAIAASDGLVCASYDGAIYRLDDAGQMVWEYKTPGPQCADMQVLGNGNILFACTTGVYEVTPKKEIVFRFFGGQKPFACQRLADGNTFVCESASGRLMVVSPQGDIVREANILGHCPKEGAPELYLRRVRVLENGNYLVAHYTGKKVCEYTPAGDPVWEYPVPGGAFAAERLPNGNTLISVADKDQNARLIEVSRSKNLVWEFSNADIQGSAPLCFMTGFDLLPNGNILAVQWLGHGHLGAFDSIFEITRDKHIVRSLRVPGNQGTLTAVRGLAAAATPHTLMADLKAAKAAGSSNWRYVILQLEAKHPYASDWLAQDADPKDAAAWLAGNMDVLFAPLCHKAAAQSGTLPAALTSRLDRLTATPDEDAALVLYLEICELRRQLRLKPLLEKTGAIVFTKFNDTASQGYSVVAEGGKSLCLLTMNGAYGTVSELFADPAGKGQIRDPEVDFDAKHILYSYSPSGRRDDFSLYEQEVATRAVRRITTEPDVADIQGAYLPDGGIVFNSSRCAQECDCISYTTFNLYRCERDGSKLRRLGYDQVSVCYPRIMDDGRVLYTRWEYNDRGQIFPQPLFQMNADGTSQTEFYGNNSWFPTSLHHARGIPGTQKAVAIASGHHTPQSGKLAIVDPAMGRQETSGIELLAPPRKPAAVREDAWGQGGDQFQYPYALSETLFITAYSPEGFVTHELPDKKPSRSCRYRLYLMDRDGRRELLASDPLISCNQPVPLMSRPRPAVRASQDDQTQADGTFFIQDVYAGPGLKDVPRGTAKTLRVVAIEYRRTSIGCSLNTGDTGGNWHVRTPISITGSWDPKRVLGEAAIQADGSASFKVPANTPVFFQVLDSKRQCIQTMRSWTTLMPGETASCVGCHEDKNSTPIVNHGVTMAMRGGVQKLAPFDGPARGFSFAREIQPILDRHCIQCHDGDRWQATENKTLTASILAYPGKQTWPEILKQNADAAVTPKVNAAGKAFSLRGDLVTEHLAARKWSDAYVGLLRPFLFPPKVIRRPGGDDHNILVALPNTWVNWVSPQSGPSLLEPYHAGACQSGLITLLENGHKKTRLNQQEMDKISCWIDLQVPFCGDYLEANAWTDDETKKWQAQEEKARRLAAMETQ